MRHVMLLVVVFSMMVMELPAFADVAKSDNYSMPIAQNPVVQKAAPADQIQAIKERTEKFQKQVNEKLVEVERVCFQKAVEELAAGRTAKAIEYLNTYDKYRRLRNAEDKSFEYISVKRAILVAAAEEYVRESEMCMVKGDYDYALTKLSLASNKLKEAEKLTAPTKK